MSEWPLNAFNLLLCFMHKSGGLDELERERGRNASEKRPPLRVLSFSEGGRSGEEGEGEVDGGN